MNGMSDQEIMRELKHYPNFKGVFCLDEVPKHLQPGAYVLNLGSRASHGTHWVSFIVDRRERLEYFDSFGFPAPQVLEKRFHHYEYNKTDIQKMNTSICGQIAIDFLRARLHYPFKVACDVVFRKVWRK